MAFNPYLARAGGAIGSGAGSLFGRFKNPSDAALPTINGITDRISPYYNPFIERGNRAGGSLENNYNNITSDPGGFINNIGKGYQQSPGFKFALEQALQGGDHAAAAGGMAGSPQHEQQNMELATHLADQDYNSWIDKALGLYGRGLSGEEGLYDKGYGASNELGQSIGNIALQKALIKYLGQNTENQHDDGGWGALLGGAGTLAGGFFGGPAGAVAGGAVGNAAGKSFGR